MALNVATLPITVGAGAFLVRDRRPETYKILGGQAPIAVDG